MLLRPLPLLVLYFELKKNVVLDESKFCSIEVIVMFDVALPSFIFIVLLLLQISSVFKFVVPSIVLYGLLIILELIS